MAIEIEFNCIVCQKLFLIPLREFDRRRRHAKNPDLCFIWCSIKCCAKSRSLERRLLVKCGYCRREFDSTKSRIKRKFCSKECSRYGRMVIGAKWRNKEHIQKYRKEYYRKNREAALARASEWTKDNRTKTLISKAKWRAANKDKIESHECYRREIVKDGSLTTGAWLRILLRCGNKCLRCKRKPPYVKLTIDHVIPLCKGGLHDEHNVQPLCVSCNSIKGIRSIDYRRSLL